MSPVSDPAYPTDVKAALLTAAHTELREHGADKLSLRAIAERAGVSRATPKWHFGDRAGLLSAVAAEGYRQLGTHLDAAAAAADPDPGARFTAIGRAYLDFGLAHRELFTLMFRPAELHADDPALVAARNASFAGLTDVTAALDPGGAALAPGSPDGLPLLAWAAAHGLVVLVRDGALQRLTGIDTDDGAADLAHRLVGVFTALARPAR
ncbi:TetR/AcrR family transcriptional regulator [Pseudonocardia tropica]|uniref:TetR/AcrR family transcriptional regulator n=1 Tax=Pseudonocardia tropica TaxID=681289 RepID=A0ABV1JQQ5_9PSEU